MLRWLGSALSKPRLRVELRPVSVRLMPRAMFQGPRVLPAPPIAVEAVAEGREDPPESWRAAVDVLDAALREPRSRLGRVEIVLSDHFVRYLLIPWSEGLVGDSERLGFARLAFRDLYGHVADTWDLCLDEQPAGQAFFACAVDRALASSLREIVARAGGQLAALIPALADCINRHRPVLKAPEFCLAAAEPGRISLAFHSRTGWQAVRSRRVDGPLAEILPTLLKQETVIGAAAEGGVFYLCTDELPGSFPLPGWRVVHLAEDGVARKRISEPRLVAARGGSGT